MGSYGLSVQLANEWQQELRERKRRTPRKIVVSKRIEDLISADALMSGAPFQGMWNHRDVGRKACEILRERLGE